VETIEELRTRLRKMTDEELKGHVVVAKIMCSGSLNRDKAQENVSCDNSLKTALSGIVVMLRIISDGSYPPLNSVALRFRQFRMARSSSRIASDTSGDFRSP
jgi:hypothetical protein